MTAPRIVIATFDTAQILDVTGPLEVFSTASRFLESASYRTDVVTARGGPVTASCGLEFASSQIGAGPCPPPPYCQCRDNHGYRGDPPDPDLSGRRRRAAAIDTQLIEQSGFIVHAWVHVNITYGCGANGCPRGGN